MIDRRSDPAALDGLGELLATLRAAGGAAAICAHCTAALSKISGVGLTLFTGPAGRFVLGAHGSMIDQIEDLQIALDQGPCMDSVRTGAPVLVEDLAGAAAGATWPAFAAQARQRGVAAMFAFPVFIGATPMAVLDLCRASPGPLSDLDYDRVTLYAAATAVLLLEDAQLQPSSQDHAGAAIPADAARSQQAIGMVMGQIRSDATAALQRLRAHAHAVDRPLDTVVADVLAGRLHFDPTPRS